MSGTFPVRRCRRAALRFPRPSSPPTPLNAPLPTPLLYPHPDIPHPGAAIEVAAGVFWLRMPLPFALDHINLWLLRDRIDGIDGWTLIDTGFGNAATRALWGTHFADTMQG